MKLTPELLQQQGAFSLTMNVGALVWGNGEKGNPDGVAYTDYTIDVPSTVKLKDEYGNQVYPAVDYKAQVEDTHKKYETLGAALKAATAGQTVNALAACETGAFEVGANVTLNLGGYGNADASYKFVGVTDQYMDAKVVSTKAETVTTDVTGFAVKDDNFTYTLYRSHFHLWEFALDGATLTANCTNMTTECDLPGRKTSITLTKVKDGSDGVAPTFAIDNQEAFLASVNKFGDVASIGDITFERTTDDGAETTKWYVGDYKAKCAVTIVGEGDKTIEQAFSIGGDLKSGGYATAVGSLTVRYDSFDEAVKAAEEGATIYYRGGEMSDQSVSFNATQDVTLDFNNKAFYYRGNADASFSNTGSGTLTIKNIELKQPRYSPTIGSRKYHNITLGGKLILAEGVKGVETDGDVEDLLVFNVVNATVEVKAGLYQSSFAAGSNGSVSISGGEFWEHFNPENTTYVAEDHVVVDATTEGYKYKVAPHEHDFYYEENGNVVTLKCKGENYQGCAWTKNVNKLTVSAPDKTDDGKPYDKLTVSTTDSFLYQTLATNYFTSAEEPLSGAPSTFGDYVVKVTVSDPEVAGGKSATAQASFTVSHVHHFEYDADQTEGTITARCTVSESCDFNVNKRIATLTAQNGTYTGAGQDLATATTNTSDFPTNVVLAYSCEGKPTVVGDYTATMTVADKSVEKGFSIAQASMSNVAITLSGTSMDYTGGSQSVSIGSVKLGDYTLVEGTDYTVDESSVFTAAGSGAQDTTSTIKIVGKGNFADDAQTVEWTIKAPTRNFDGFAKNDGVGGTLSGTTLTMAGADWKYFAADSAPDGSGIAGWYAGITIDWPSSLLQYTRHEKALFTLSTKSGSFTGEAVLDKSGELTISTTSANSGRCMEGATWWTRLTPALAEACEDASFVRTMTACGLTWWHPWTESTGYGDKEGVREVTCTVTQPMAETVVLTVPMGATYDLGTTKLAKSALKLAKNVIVTTTVEQVEGKIFTEEDGYSVYCIKDGDVFKYVCFLATHYVTVPDVEHATKVVTVDDEAVTGKDNVYPVFHGKTVTIVYTPETGYETSDGTKTIANVTADTTLTDLPTVTATSYTITYELDGGVNNPANPASYTIESETITLADPTKTDYNFTGWTPEGVIAKGSTGDKTFTATWKLATVEFTVAAPDNASVAKVATNGVEMVAPYKVLPGTAVTVSYKADEGYLFANGKNTMDAEITVDQGGEQPAPTGTETTKGEAKIGTQYYLTLKDALDAVEAGTASGTVELLADATINDAFGFGKDVKVDLNGKQFTANGAIAVTNGATVALVNSKSTAPSKTGSEGGFAPNAVITVEGGATIDLSALPFGTTYGGIQGTGSLTLASGSESKFYKWDVASVDSANWMFANYPAFFTGSVLPVGAKVTIGDKTWTGTANGFEVPGTVAFAQIDATGNLGGVEFPIVVNECYTSLADAVAVVKNNGTVKLVADTTTTAWIRFNENYNVTLDLNGKTISSDSDECLVMGLATATQLGTGTLTITGNGSVIQTADREDCDVVWARHGNVVISNGYFEVNGTYQCVYSTNRAKIDIYGGTFKNVTGGDVLNVNNAGETTDIQCFGGSYSKDPATGDDAMGGTFVAEGYASYKDGEMFTVAKLPAVTVTDITPPADLEAAFRYATTDTTSAFTGGWKVDFYVSFDADVAAGAVLIKGKYGEYPWTGAALPAMAADEEIPLMQTAGNEVSVEQLLAMQTFDCGVTNVSAAGGTTMTVVLKMYKGDESFVLSTKTYKLVGKGPTIVDPIGGDPETAPTIKPVEGTNGVYEVEVKTNETTTVMIDGLQSTDKVVVPEQIDNVAGDVKPDQVIVVGEATNEVGAVVKVDITTAFVIEENGISGVTITLNDDPTAEVKVVIGEKEETIKVTPELTESEDAVKPLVIDETKVATGVKTIPGLKYSLLSGDKVTKIDTLVKTIVAEDTRVVLEAVKAADPAKFYKIQVAK